MLTTLLNASLDEDLEPVRIRASWRATAVSVTRCAGESVMVTRRRGLMGVARHCATGSRSPELDGTRGHAKLMLLARPSAPALSSSRNSAARSAARDLRRITITIPW
jgi:hypothetical protein